ncbi:MAG: hypothetical protein ABFS09_09450 [Thermodesulfobacteriota bacterium]
MRTTMKSLSLFTALLALTVFACAGTVNAAEKDMVKTKPVITDKFEMKTSTMPNKFFHNRRGYYDRYNDVWVYRVRVR